MVYTNDSHITSVKDVKTFFHHIVFERKVNFHPDDAFDQYICTETREPSFSPDECTLYDRLIDESFNVCEKEGVDIYEIGLEELQGTLGINVA